MTADGVVRRSAGPRPNECDHDDRRDVRARFEDLGPNAGLVDEMYRRYRENPDSVVAELARVLRRLPARAPATATPPAPAAPRSGARRAAGAARRLRPRRPPHRRAAPIVLDGETPEPLRGAAARIVENMEASLGVPTATSVRDGARPSCSRSTARSSTTTSPRTRGGKVSFTHLIGYAVVRALRRRARA